MLTATWERGRLVPEIKTTLRVDMLLQLNNNREAVNALRLNGQNNQWMPIVNMIDYLEFQVLIYNRYGELIYQLNDQTQSWNGSMLNSSDKVPIGVYVFLMQFKNPSGQLFTKKGHITVVN